MSHNTVLQHSQQYSTYRSAPKIKSDDDLGRGLKPGVLLGSLSLMEDRREAADNAPSGQCKVNSVTLLVALRYLREAPHHP